MSTKETSSNRFDAYLAQIESRERNKRRRYQISAALGVLLLIGGVSFWLYTPAKDAELRHYEASSLNYSMVKNLFDNGGGEFVVAHPAIGVVDTIYSAEDYLSLRGLLDELEVNNINQSGETAIDVPPTYAVDIAGSREAGASLLFSIENYDESLTYMIDFGNGYRREVENSITYSYRRSGNFRLRLIATNEQGSSSIYNKSIKINSASGSSSNETVIAQTAPVQEEATDSDSIEQPAESQQPDLVAMRGAQMRTPETIRTEVPNARATVPVIEEEEVAPVPSSMDPLVMAEIAPQFPGGLNAMGSFIKSNYRYPRDAQRANIEGKVFVQFVVNADGSISNERVIRGIGGGCDEEAMRLVQMMPKWTPGRQDGQVVAAYHTVPITFKLLR